MRKGLVFRSCVAVMAMLAPGLPLQPAAAAQQSERAADLDIIVTFFVPGRQLEQLVVGGCETAFRTHLTTDPDHQAMERTVPGTQDRMVAAAAAHCRDRVPAIIEDHAGRARAFWASSTSAPDLARLARLFEPAVRDLEARDILYREGDMAATAARRAFAGSDPASFQEAMARFSRSPGGAALLRRAGDYRSELQAAIEEDIVGVAMDAKRSARRAANAHARAAGYSDPFPEE